MLGSLGQGLLVLVMCVAVSTAGTLSPSGLLVLQWYNR